MNDKPEDIQDVDDIIFAGIPEDLSLPEVRMDTETFLETFLVIAGLVGIIATIAMVVDPADRNLLYIGLTLILTVLSFYTRSQVDCTYIIDNMKKVILYRRTIFGSTTNTHICSFSDIYSTAVRGKFVQNKSSSYWGYEVIIVLKSGEVVSVTSRYNHDKGFDACNTFAENLAEHLEVNLFEGAPQQGVKVIFDENSGKVELTDTDGQEGQKEKMRGLMGFLLIILLFTVIFAVYFVYQ